MSDDIVPSALHRKRLLVVEDEYLVADDMRCDLERLGADVLGPAASVGAAMSLLDRTPDLDGAILDVNLCGEMVFPVAGALHARGVPFVFWTGYDSVGIPDPYREVPRLQKLEPTSDVVRALLHRLAAAAGPVPAAPVLADVYLDPDGTHLLATRDGPEPLCDHGLAWIGATLLDTAEWGARLRVRLRPGVLYRVPWRYAANLRQQLAVMG